MRRSDNIRAVLVSEAKDLRGAFQSRQEIRSSHFDVPSTEGAIANSAVFSDRLSISGAIRQFEVAQSSRTRKDIFQHNIEICVPPFFGNISHTDVIEFIEVVRLFGTERIHFYNYQVSPSTEAVLSYYEKLGTVTVLSWKLDKRLTSSEMAMHYYGQGTHIQECLYRHLFSTRFLAFMDIDEVFVPANHSSWFSMMTSVKNYQQLAGIIVPSPSLTLTGHTKGTVAAE